MDASSAHAMNTPDNSPALPPVLVKNLEALASANSETYRTLVEYLPQLTFAVTRPLPGMALTHHAQTYEVLAYPDYSALAALPKIDNRASVCLVIGIGSGHELIEICKRTNSANSAVAASALPLYVLEPDPCALLAVLCVHDLSTALNSGRLLIWSGAQALDNYIAYMENNRQAMFPTQHLTFLPQTEAAFAQQAVARINQLTHATDARIKQAEQAVAAYYNEMDTQAWRSIYADGARPLRIMGCTSRFTTFLQYCIRDLLAGFDKLGCTTLLHQETAPIMRTTKYDILETINEFRPDLIIYIDHFRDEYPYIPANIPFVNWIQDLLPNITQPAARTLCPNDFTFVFARQWVNTLGVNDVYAGHDIRVLPLGINPDVYHPIEASNKTFDVLYVSHLVHPELTLRPLVNHSHKFDINADEAELLATKLISYDQLILVYLLMSKTLDSLLIDDLWKYITSPQTRQSFVKRTLERAGIESDGIIFDYFCHSKRINNDIAYAIKTRPLKTIVSQGFDVRIYGNNWELIEDLKEHAYGSIENGAELNLLMNQARICLNNSPGTSLHMRALEILGSGSFILSRSIYFDTSDIEEYFKKDAETIVFKNEFDIGKIVKQWLHDESAREKLARAAHLKAMDLFAYQHTAETITQTIIERLNS